MTSQKNVLIIEREAIIALDIKRRFLNQGYKIAGMTSSLKETFIKMKDYKDVDLILLDSNLSDFKHLFSRAEKIYKSIKKPVILLNAYTDDYIQSECRKYKSIRVVEKPFKNEEFQDAIENTIQLAN